MWGNINKIIVPLLIVILVVLGGTTYYFVNRYSQLKKDPQQAVRQQTQVLVDKIAKLIVLPQGEEPTIATVTDPDQLKDQPFFANAQKGDIVLIYTNARKAILYNPTENKIVEVAPLNIGPAPQAPATPETPATTTSE